VVVNKLLVLIAYLKDNIFVASNIAAEGFCLD
jgi:hypothetical protein